LPVTKKAFEKDMDSHLETLEDERIIKMLTSVLSMYDEYAFFSAPTYANLDANSSAFEEEFKKILNDDRAKYSSGETVSAEDALAQIRKK
ncbi:MAG: hypothetical protein IJ334_10720, partial [Clostridia bacterium]|nr:hypothetical protein [Clostridia bacterium]